MSAYKNFDAWMQETEACIKRKCGLESADLDDHCYRDDYEDGYSPAESANRAINRTKAA